MEKATIKSFSLLIGLVTTILVQGQVFQHVGVPETTSNSWTMLHRGPQGSLFRHWENDSTTWMQFDASGYPVWSKRNGEAVLEPHAFIQLSDGGYLSSDLGTYEIQNLNLNDDDTVTFGIITSWFDPAGDLLHRVRHDRTLIDDMPLSVGFIRDIQVAESADGTLYFLIHHDSDLDNYVEVLKTDAQGQLIWARAIGSASSIMPLGLPRFDPSIGSAFLNLRFETVDSSGVIIQNNKENFNGHQLFRVGSNGDLLQASGYTSTVPQSFMESSEITQDLDGNILSHTTLQVGMEFTQLFIRTDHQGSVVEIDQMEEGSIYNLLDLDVTSDNAAVLLAEEILICPRSGPVATAYRQRNASDQDHEYIGRTYSLEIQDDTLTALGIWLAQDNMSGVYTSAPQIARCALDSFPDCMWSTSTYARSDLPLNTIQVTDLLADRISLPTEQFYTTLPEPAPIVFVPIPLPTMIDRCSLATDVAEHDGQSSLLMLYPSPLKGNGVLYLEQEAGERYRILDMSGRSVGTGRPGVSEGRQSIPLPGLGAGLYLLELMDATGSRTGTGRFLVE